MKKMQEIEALSLNDARRYWRKTFKTAAPAHRSRDLLLRAISYQIQAKAEGGLGRATRRKLDELAERFVADRAYAPQATEKLKPGSVLVREWNNQRHGVTVTSDGFLYDGKPYQSLTAVAKVITGVHWNGPRFFRIRGGADEGATP